MLRLRVLLLLLWYYSITKASIINTPNKQTNDDERTTTERWNYLQLTKDNPDNKNDDLVVKTKREIIDSNESDENKLKEKRPEKNRRKAGPDYLDVVDTENTRYLKHLASLISKYRGKYVQYGFVVGRAEDIIDLDMIRRCMTPVEIPKHFSPWLGKRGAGFQDAIQKKCLDTLVQPVDYRPSTFDSDDGKNLKPFRPWGGKRDSGDAKKTNFGAWGGKRYADDSTPKKAEFNAWGGKRVPEYPFNPIYPHDRYYPMLLDSDNMERQGRDAKFNAWGGKRSAKFNAWGGKRAFDNPILEANELENDKRNVKFNAWGGKRDAKFNAWGGKRAYGHPILETEDLDEQKRDAKFNAWGGKRAYEYPMMDSDDLDEQKRDARFNAWGGKRNAKFSAWGGKRAFDYPYEPEDIDAEKRNAQFSAWGGKRSENSFKDANPINKNNPENMDRQARLAKFSAWGGKRSILDSQPDADEIEELIVPSSDGFIDDSNDLPDAIFLTRNRINVQSMGNVQSFQGRLMPPDFDDELDTLGAKPNQTSTQPIRKKRSFSAWGGKRTTIPDWTEDKTESLESKQNVDVPINQAEVNSDEVTKLQETK